MELIRDKHGKLTGIIRDLAGKKERLYTPTGTPIADYDQVTRATYDTDRRRIGSGNRLAGLVEAED